MNNNKSNYFKFTSKSRLDKSINTLIGIIEGIAADGSFNDSEINFLNIWINEHSEVRRLHPFNELIPVVKQAVSDRVITEEEKEDILWLCEKLRSTEFYDATTADLQRLHAILGGIASDGIITAAELEGLSTWLLEHEHLRKCWPFDEVDSLITEILSDKKIDEKEHQILKSFFTEFIDILDEKTITNPLVAEKSSIAGLCAICPEISFKDSTFCLTGKSFKYTRSQFEDLVNQLGGIVMSSVSTDLDYLIIGADGNPCWSYSCYGRKVEKAVELRKKGIRLLLIHENDFHDAVEDLH